LADEIRGQIAAGRLLPGAKIDSIRELAAFYAVNPNTVQRALAELERSGLISTRRASGKTVTEDEQVVKNLRSTLATGQTNSFLSVMEALGFSAGETRELFEQTQKERSTQAGGPGGLGPSGGGVTGAEPPLRG
jgi:DNA-binding transcriptional regulator YhcF (GntR family)